MRTVLLLSTLILLPLTGQVRPAHAQPAVPAVPGAAPARAAAPTATPAPAAAPAPVARSSADDPPTTDTAARPPAPVASAAPAPRSASAVPAVGPAASAAPPSTSAAPPTSAPPTTAPTTTAPIGTASAAPPTTDAPPTTTPTGTTPGAPSPDSILTVARNAPLTPEGNAAFLAAYAARPDIVKLPGGTFYRVLVKGTGKSTPLGRSDTVTVSYRGWLIDGTNFDSSPVGSPRVFQLNNLIPGWREALLKMKEGDLFEIVIPADQAYGAEGRPGRIPPNQTLVFVVSLAHVAYAG